MFGASRVNAFYKANKHMNWANPGRRWVSVKMTLGGFFLFLASFPASYYWTSTRDETLDAQLAGNWHVMFLELLPLNIASRYIGYSAALTAIPASWHQTVIRWIISFYGVTDVTPEEATDYSTLQQFFLRDRAQPVEVDTTAALVSPCDGIIVESGEILRFKGESPVHDPSPAPSLEDEAAAKTKSQTTLRNHEASLDQMLQAKGVKYTIGNLLRVSSLPAVEKGYRRWYWTLYLQPGAYHHFHSPASKLNVNTAIYVPGILFPIAPSMARWLPNLYTNNERVNILGEYSHGLLAMSFIGATNVGGIHLNFDQRIETNPLLPVGQFSLKRHYTKGAVQFSAGEDIGHFRLGSCIVLIADLPKEGFTPLGRKGDPVIVGQALVGATSKPASS